MHVASIILLTTVLAGSAATADVRLICENPRREYHVVYTIGTASLVINANAASTIYPILIDDNSDQHHIVIASTPDGGPTARLHLRPYTKMEFWSGGQILQTDGCYVLN